MTTEVAFSLFWDMSYLGDDEHVASLVKYKGCETTLGWQMTRPIAVPERIYFEANVSTLQIVDFPDNDENWPIMSTRMRDVLFALGPVNCRLLPIIMLDDTVPSKDRFDRSGAPRPGVALEGFSAVHLLEHIDAFDWERSQYTRDEDLPHMVNRLTKLVLKQVDLPPLFRLSAAPMHLFVSAVAKEALERAGIKGAQYRSLDRVRN